MIERISSPTLFLLALCTHLSLVGCDSHDFNEGPSIGGTYIGSHAIEGGPGTTEIVFPSMESGEFDFDGDFGIVLRGVLTHFPVSGSGTYDFPDISIDMTLYADEDFTPLVRMEGLVSDAADLMILTDQDGQTITMRRQ